jgi:RIO-like serine/threonine protein kinase
LEAARTLKHDLFGLVRTADSNGTRVVVRDTGPAAFGLGWLARALLRREVRALRALAGLDTVPGLIAAGRDVGIREYVAGDALQVARCRDPGFYRQAARALRSMHRRNVVHNDLAKEPNLLVTPGGSPVFIDFQLAVVAKRRHKLFRILAREDIRHLLKHKRTYCPDALTQRERRLLASPSLPSLWFRRTVKPVYLFVTRRILGWSDREGAGDRSPRR